MANLRQDLRFAVRMLLTNPMLTAAAVLTLALGIGLNAAVFSAVHTLLFRPIPEVRNDAELVQLYWTWPGDMTPGYFAAMGIPVLTGRAFGEVDSRDGAPVLLINQKFADRFFPGENAVGKIVRTAGQDREVIGVVKTGKYRSLGEDPLDFMYLAQAQVWNFPMTAHIRISN